MALGAIEDVAKATLSMAGPPAIEEDSIKSASLDAPWLVRALDGFPHCGCPATTIFATLVDHFLTTF